MGMGPPHTPPPPLITLVASWASTPFLPAYFLAMSLKAGPMTFLSTVWQARQALLWASSWLACAGRLSVADTATAASSGDSSLMGGHPFSLRDLRGHSPTL